jgi:hypothetical protein
MDDNTDDAALALNETLALVVAEAKRLDDKIEAIDARNEALLDSFDKLVKLQFHAQQRTVQNAIRERINIELQAHDKKYQADMEAMRAQLGRLTLLVEQDQSDAKKTAARNTQQQRAIGLDKVRNKARMRALEQEKAAAEGKASKLREENNAVSYRAHPS